MYDKNGNKIADGIVCFIRCAACGKEVHEFTSLENAKTFIQVERWTKVGRSVICPECSKRLFNGRPYAQVERGKNKLKICEQKYLQSNAVDV